MCSLKDPIAEGPPFLAVCDDDFLTKKFARTPDGSLYSKKELKAAIEAVMDKDSPPIRFLIRCAENWATWDAALFYAPRKKK
jgi:hypothetical protein